MGKRMDDLERSTYSKLDGAFGFCVSLFLTNFCLLLCWYRLVGINGLMEQAGLDNEASTSSIQSESTMKKGSPTNKVNSKNSAVL